MLLEAVGIGFIRRASSGSTIGSTSGESGSPSDLSHLKGEGLRQSRFVLHTTEASGLHETAFLLQENTDL